MYTMLQTSYRYDPRGVSYVNRTILRKCTMTATRVQTVDTRPLFFSDEWPGYEAGMHEQSTNHISLIKQA